MVGGQAFVVAGAAAVSDDPGQGAFHDPTSGQHDEPGHVVGAFDDLQDCKLDNGAPRTENWPDTPWDLVCDPSCPGDTPMTFFITTRLAQITTRVSDGGAYRTVGRWDLAHEFPSTGNSTSPVLWLSSITRTAFST